MLTPEDAAFLAAAVEDLAAPLYKCFDTGYTQAHKYYDEHGMTGTGYTRGRTDLARDHARRGLEQEKQLGGWNVATRRSGRLHLHRETLSLHVLHAAPIDMIPAPGRNKARISYFRNPTIDLFGVQSSNLLAVWLDPPEEGGEISIRIVRPIGFWKPGRPPKFDFDLELPRDTQSFEDWEFVADEGGLTLPFEFDEDFREEGGTGGA